MTERYKPGTDNAPPGKYKEVGPRGGEVPKGHTATKAFAIFSSLTEKQRYHFPKSI